MYFLAHILSLSARDVDAQRNEVYICEGEKEHRLYSSCDYELYIASAMRKFSPSVRGIKVGRNIVRYTKDA